MALTFNAATTNQAVSFPALSGVDLSSLAFAVCGWATFSALAMPASDSGLLIVDSSAGVESLGVGVCDSGGNAGGLYVRRLNTSVLFWRAETLRTLFTGGVISANQPFWFCVQHTGDTANDAAQTQFWLRLPGDAQAVSRAVNTLTATGTALGTTGNNQLTRIGNRANLGKAHRGGIWDVGVWTRASGTGNLCLSAQNIADLSLGQDPRLIVPNSGATLRRFPPLYASGLTRDLIVNDNGTLVGSPTTLAQPHAPRGTPGLAIATADGVPVVGANVVYVDPDRAFQGEVAGQNDVTVLVPGGNAGVVLQPQANLARGSLCTLTAPPRRSVAAVPEGNSGGSGQGPRLWYVGQSSTLIPNKGFHLAAVVSRKVLAGTGDVTLFQIGGSPATLVGFDGRGRLFVTINGVKTLPQWSSGKHMHAAATPMPILVSVSDPGGSSAATVIVRTPHGRATWTTGAFTAAAAAGALTIGEDALHGGDNGVYWNLYRLALQDAALTSTAQENAAWAYLLARAGLTGNYKGGLLWGFTSTAAGTGPAVRLGIAHNMSLPAVSDLPDWWVAGTGIGAWVGASSGNSVEQEITLSAADPAIVPGAAVTDIAGQTATVHSVTPDGLIVNLVATSAAFSPGLMQSPATALITAISTRVAQDWADPAQSLYTWSRDALNQLPDGVPVVVSPFYSSELAVFGQTRAGVVAIAARFRQQVLADVTGRPVRVVPLAAHPRRPFGFPDVNSLSSGGARNYQLNLDLAAAAPTLPPTPEFDYFTAAGVFDGGGEDTNTTNAGLHYQEASASATHLNTAGAVKRLAGLAARIAAVFGSPGPARRRRRD